MTKTAKFTLSALVAALALTSGNALAQTEDGIDVSGTLRIKYAYRDYSEDSTAKGGEIGLDIAAIKFNGKKGDWGISAEYRFTSDSHFIKHGYGYFDASPDWQIQFGMTKNPFGNHGFISNSFWLGMPYYLGMEDDSDMGIKAVYSKDGWHSDIAFFKNSEYAGSENKQYAADLYSGSVNGTDYSNQESNQLSLRQTYTMQHQGGSTTVGGSLQIGQIYNNLTQNNGDRYAAAVHLDSTYNGWNLQLQAIQYEFNAADSVDPNKVALAFLSWQYEVAAKGQIYSLNIAKTIPTSFGSVKCYNDFGLLTPDVANASYDNSKQNVIGCAVAAGPTYTMFDFIMGNNMVFATPLDDHIGLAQIGKGWDKRININFGYYF
jgi:hypothetical protein